MANNKGNYRGSSSVFPVMGITGGIVFAGLYFAYRMFQKGRGTSFYLYPDENPYYRNSRINPTH